jgi:hypothetical protein
VPRNHRQLRKGPSPISGGTGEVRVLPSLATAEQIAEVLQITARTVHYWADREEIPTALRCGKIVRFHPPAVAAALGLNLPDFGMQPTGHAQEACTSTQPRPLNLDPDQQNNS